jgi:hypothetical protein
MAAFNREEDKLQRFTRTRSDGELVQKIAFEYAFYKDSKTGEHYIKPEESDAVAVLYSACATCDKAVFCELKAGLVLSCKAKSNLVIFDDSKLVVANTVNVLPTNCSENPNQPDNTKIPTMKELLCKYDK